MNNLAYIEHYSYEDYKNWEGDWELIDGKPYAMSPSPMKSHQTLAYEIAFRLREKLEETDCQNCEVFGEFDYKISNDTVLKPDLVFVCDESNENYLTKAPEIIFEIVSPSTAKRDEIYKFSIYEQEKVKYYVLVYPQDLKAKVYKLKGKNYDKEGDFTFETYFFSDIKCEVELDFDKVFKRFRKK